MGTNKNYWPNDDSSETINIYNPWHVPQPRLFPGLLNHSDIFFRKKDKRRLLPPASFDSLRVVDPTYSLLHSLLNFSSKLLSLMPPPPDIYYHFFAAPLSSPHLHNSLLCHLFSPLEFLPFPLRSSYCSHLLIDCKPSCESNGQAFGQLR